MEQQSYRSKEEIEKDERIRIQIRKSLEPKERKILTVLNSPFFLWFMSSCVLASITFLYNQSQNRIQREKVRLEQEFITQQRVEKIDNEIYLRLDNNETWLIEWKVRNNESKTKIDSTSFMPFNPCKRLLNSPEADNIYYPEFKNRNLISLVLELKEMVKAESEIAALDKTINRLKCLKSEFYYRTKFKAKDYDRFTKELKSIFISRWDPIVNLSKQNQSMKSQLDSLNQVYKDL